MNEHALSPLAPLRERERLLKVLALALAADEPSAVSAIALQHGVSGELALDLLATDEGHAAAMVELERMRDAGELVRHRALRALDRAVDKMDQALGDRSVGPAIVARIANELFKIAGLAEERAAKLRRDAPVHAPQIIFNILTEDGESLLPPELLGANGKGVVLEGVSTVGARDDDR